MYPVLFRIGGIEVRTWGVLVLLGFLAGMEVTYQYAKRYGYKREDIYDIGFYVVLASIIGARVFYILYNFHEFKNNLWEMFAIWHGGLVFFGGVVFAIPVAAYFIKKRGFPLWKFADWTAPGFAIGMFIGRWGCFFNGCCFGRACHGPFCTVFKPGSEAFAVFGPLPIHPTQLYESFGNLIVFFVLIWVAKRKPFDGFVFLLYMILGPLVRFLVDYYRYYETYKYYGPFDVNQWISIGLMSASLILLIVLYRKNKEKGNVQAH